MGNACFTPSAQSAELDVKKNEKDNRKPTIVANTKKTVEGMQDVY